ncbi:uncharacterized protein LOC131649052 [Vicia villosa]|uniref:uncharacterized protein LOC131649052 n=1 Tax=Vicia villosa TaxID=3911 RepID=UPI00273AB1AF|nr:uncharacterized protein LOC131649052 [Vicia villosa]
MNPLLGFVQPGQRSDDKEDPQERSTKKFKGKGLDGDNEGGGDVQAGAKQVTSFKELLMGSSSMSKQRSDRAVTDVLNTDLSGEMRITEHTIGDYECPEIILSEKAEERIAGPWRKGVIVKMLGKRIGYKALENRLNQIWARHGTLSIVDLGNDYSTVSFTSDDDQYVALMEGPWLIYDHYLSVREWKPNFFPSSDAIEQIAVWVRISGLPLEYYDARVLAFIGNRIGSTVKVDRNTLSIKRGKYTRLCVQVDLTKPLLAMFAIKGRHYKIEYEGLHLFCLSCGRFGHNKEDCGEVNVRQEPCLDGQQRKQSSKEGTDGNNEIKADGPWVVVQKIRRNKKNKQPEIKDFVRKVAGIATGGIPVDFNGINGGDKTKGSRFIVLNDNTPAMEIPDVGDNDLEVNDGEEIISIIGDSQSLNTLGPRTKRKEKKRLAKKVVTQVTRGISKEGKKVGLFGKSKAAYEKLMENEGISPLQSNSIGPVKRPDFPLPNIGPQQSNAQLILDEVHSLTSSQVELASPKKPPDAAVSSDGSGKRNDKDEARSEMEKDVSDIEMVEETPVQMNCRGAASKASRRVCYQYLQNVKPSIVVILETRTNPANLAKIFKILGFDSLIGSEVQGYAGGIALAWNSSKVKVELLKRHFQFLHLRLNLDSGEEFFFTPVYASPRSSGRTELWEESLQLSRHNNQSWIVGGDFNDILKSSETKGGAPVSKRRCDLFKDRIDACNLLDLDSVGHRFTWKGPIFHGGGRIYERLDRVLSNDNWRLQFPQGFVKVFPRVDFSDHHPIVLQ